ncbi:hypothetical protein P9384_06660 [Bacillus pumilus]|uniref:MerR family transcriptional regulator n=1 Tax=Bacillus pumilus TaxID=1408 RepID=A0AB34QQI6_BACPU|nr:hypothetical protein [Bacillus pumilus]KIL13603.1 hypothetical protein B4127_0615 [Bacillus pumilus]MDM5319013.1 hypothetical protein [Bacillus pumilus]MED4628816.1 hypothetical protein [Bacillus pumilus]MED4675622.1 hypothetical protein [Bacillus pumilus]RAP11881.1 hypothetical protein C2W58_03532 [Bacillus pumilus]
MKKIFWVIGGVILILGAFSYYMTYNKLNEEKNQAIRDKQKIENKMSKLEESEAADMNQKFFEAFFQYEDADDREGAVRKLATDKAMSYAFPSKAPKKHSVTMQGDLLSLESYSKKVDEKHELYLNEAKIALTVNAVTTKQELIIQTELKKEKGGWIVDNVQVKGSN